MQKGAVGSSYVELNPQGTVIREMMFDMGIEFADRFFRAELA